MEGGAELRTERPGGARFPETQWSMVLKAGDGGHAPALDQLCRIYWRPLFNYCCSSGRSVADAEDLTQGYFAQLLANDALRFADPGRGRFRTFLLSSFKNYLTDAHRRGSATKRGGDAVHVSFEMNVTDGSVLPLAPDVSPDEAFDRQWACDVVQRAKALLRAESEASGRGEWFEAIAGEQEGPGFAELASRFRATEDALKSYSKRLKSRFRNLLEQEIANTVAEPEDVAAEMAYVTELLRK